MTLLPEEIMVAIERMRLMGSDTQRYEVKAASQGLPESLAETISAFANRDGGTIILGLDEKNGFTPAHGFDAKRMHDALQRLGNELTPACWLEIERYPFENAEIVVGIVQAIPLDQRPCYISRKGLRFGAFIRTGDGDKRLTDYEIDRMREFHRPPAFDRQPVDEATMDDLDDAILDAIVERNREISPRIFGKMDRQRILFKLGAIAPSQANPDQFVPTLAGLLVAGIYPQQFFPRLNITFTVYPGLSKAQARGQSMRYLHTQSVNGSIPEMLISALQLLRAHTHQGAQIDGALRREITDYPTLACREAIINALQHRDYSPQAMGSQVQINLFADRLEILNPGGLYGAASFHSFAHGISATRNTRLSQLLEYTPYASAHEQPGYVIENRGTGLEQIQQELKEAHMPQADLKDFVSAFQITFFKRQQAVSEASAVWSDFESALLSELQAKGAMSVAQIMASSGLSRNTVSVHLRNLRARGLIEATERAKSPKQRYRLTRS